jgi:ArsR family transcriptional regulator
MPVIPLSSEDWRKIKGLELGSQPIQPLTPCEFTMLSKSLGDDIRYEILYFVLLHPNCILQDIQHGVRISFGQSTHHVKILVQSGLVSSRKSGKVHLHRVDEGKLRSLENFIENLLQKELE